MIWKMDLISKHVWWATMLCCVLLFQFSCMHCWEKNWNFIRWMYQFRFFVAECRKFVVCNILRFVVEALGCWSVFFQQSSKFFFENSQCVMRFSSNRYFWGCPSCVPVACPTTGFGSSVNKYAWELQLLPQLFNFWHDPTVYETKHNCIIALFAAFFGHSFLLNLNVEESA